MREVLDKMKSNKVMEDEINRLKPFFEHTTPDKKALAEDLINQAGFMKSILYQLQEQISKEGTTDEYSNGATQSGVKISAKMQSYNSMIKNYIAINKQLATLLPKELKSATIVDPLGDILSE